LSVRMSRTLSGISFMFLPLRGPHCRPPTHRSPRSLGTDRIASRPVHVGLVILPTDRSVRVDDLAVEAEARGFESLFVGEHSHIPVSRRTPFIMGGDLSDEYRRTVDPFVALSTAAARTATIRLGTCVFLVAQRDPISTAKQVASLDFVSGGRFELGVGYGWNAEEAENHGVAWSSRRRRTTEFVAAMRQLWTVEEASFRGEFVNFEPSWMWPKPVQQPGPPVLLGCGPGPRNFADIVAWGDGWFPVPFLGHTVEDVRTLWQLAADAGRDPAGIRITVNGVMPDPGQFDEWQALGVHRVLVPLASTSLDEIRAVLDVTAPLVARAGER
jgi:probable F420-dependent oxidoreductase